MLLRAAFLGAVVAAIVYFVSSRFGLKSIGAVITTADPALVSAALVANLASVGAKALTWQAALDAVPADEEGGERIHVKLLEEVIPAIFIGFLLNTVLVARLGEVARVSVLRRKLIARGVDMPVPTAVGTLVTEQLLLGGDAAGRAARHHHAGLDPRLGGRPAVGAGGGGLHDRHRRRRDRGLGPLPAAAGRQRRGERSGRALVDAARPVGHGDLERAARTGRRSSATPGCSPGACSRQRCHGWRRSSASTGRCTRTASTPGSASPGWCSSTSTLVGLFPIVPGNIVVFQGATVAALTFATNVGAEKAFTFSIGLQLIEALLSVGLGFFFLSYEGLSLGELRTEAEASDKASAPS